MRTTKRLYCAFLGLTAMGSPVVGQRLVEPSLRDWAAPHYWAPTRVNEEPLSGTVTGTESDSGGQSAAGALTAALVFVAMTPCRVVDTRADQGKPAPWGAPGFAGNETRTYNLPLSPCGIPAAAAYSLNFTVLQNKSLIFLSAWPAGQPFPAASTLNALQGGFVANAAVVPAGPNGGINVLVSDATDVIIDINGYYVPPGGVPLTGTQLLPALTFGSYNTGHRWLQSLQNESSNVAIGPNAMINASGNTNNNTAVGSNALAGTPMQGNANIALGAGAGSLLTSGNSNIYIGNNGAATQSGTIRIGDSGQSAAYISGIFGVSSLGTGVLVSSDGRLGVSLSSRRYKEDIQDMREASSNVMRLRPVTFRYKRPAEDGGKPLQYGLIAEEVAEVYPDLVVRGKDGQLETVQYQKLDVLLLNEMQKQQKTIEEQARRIAALENLVQSLAKTAQSTAAGAKSAGF